MTALVIAEGVVIALLVILVAGLLKSHGDILRRLHAIDGGEQRPGRTDGLQIAPRPGKSVPASIVGITPSGDANVVAMRDGRGLVLLAFLSSGCSTCRPFWTELDGSATMPADNVRPIIVTKGPAEESPASISDLAPAGTLTLMSSEAWDDFQIPVSPYFVLVDAVNGAVVGEGAASTWPHVSELLGQALADATNAAESRDTTGRIRRASDDLSAAGIDHGDPSLYRNPHEGHR